MTQSAVSTILTSVLDSKELTDTQLKTLRQTVWGDNFLSMDEADLIFKVNEAAVKKPVQWNDFFVSSMTTFLVRQNMPTGYIDAANAAWLMERIDHDGVLELETEFELLMNVMHIAESVPDRLEMYALRQVRSCVMEGRGYLADGRKLQPGVIEDRDVEILRKILYACGGDGGFGITQAEAELLFDLDEITQDQDNHENWRDLFVGAVANYLMTLGAPVAPSAEEARRRQDWLESDTGLTFNLKKSLGAWISQFKETRQVSVFDDVTGIAWAEKIDLAEAEWLIARLNRDGKLSPNEVALLEFINTESPSIHQSLVDLIYKAA